MQRCKVEAICSIHVVDFMYLERSIRKWVLWIFIYIKFKSIYLPNY